MGDTTLVLASNYYNTRAHYSNNLEPAPFNRPGRVGTALCSTEANVVDVSDGVRQADQTYGRSRPKPAADLPLCKRCAKRAERMQTSG